MLTVLRPYLLGLSVLLIFFGFYQGRRTKQCQRKPRLLTTILLWSSTAIVALSILFPQIVAELLAG